MSKKKPYWVELRTTAVIMAETADEAERIAPQYARACFEDEGPVIAEGAIEITSLAALEHLDGEWTGDCVPYNEKNGTPLSELLPDGAPLRDTRTIDMFDDGDAMKSGETQ